MVVVVETINPIMKASELRSRSSGLRQDSVHRAPSTPPEPSSNLDSLCSSPLLRIEYVSLGHVLVNIRPARVEALASFALVLRGSAVQGGHIG